MTNKLKQSIAVQRQIPEHIRNSYPIFVEFVKAYYEFLGETQTRSLEEIRDIDLTLDEFIERFKSELAKNVPIELASDKRKLLKHMRDFYLTRGSEASFQFLFKTLFEKEASLFYPSSQILRASDGKWTQDVSIFVELTGNTPDFSIVDGKFITINTGRKNIQTFVENVIQYDLNTFEVFIQRDYAGEIVVNSTVAYVENGTTYTGRIVPCPSKLSIFKPGKGFKAGDLFSLQTQLGRGCTIKVTKTNSEGGILALQVIKFGLDYKTKFYSYLSNKDHISSEYIHPLEIGEGTADVKEYSVTVDGQQTFNIQYLIEGGSPLLVVEVARNNAPVTLAYTATTGTNVTISGLLNGDIVNLYGILTKGIAPDPNVPSYNERSGGFIDYGFASKQTYMFYDEQIPVGAPERRSDRYFVDATYVGEIQSQFYANDTKTVVDEDLAIIEIDLGAIAKYPGYYQTADGFISDEMHIHDGEYYQAFSYVIKVEEELRSYADIIRALVHPAGMKLFAEYNIYKELKLEFTRTIIRSTLQLPVDGRPITNANVFDGGYNYTSYDYDALLNEYVPSEGAGRVFSRQGKAALFTLKQLQSIALIASDFNQNLVEKPIEDQQIVINTRNSKAIVKPILDSINEYLESFVKNANKTINSNQAQLSLIDKSLSKPFSHTFASDDAQFKTISKPFDDNIVDQLDDTKKEFFKNLQYLQLLLDAQNSSIDKPLSETINSISNVSQTFSKPFEVDEISYSDLSVNELLKNVEEYMSTLEELNREFTTIKYEFIESIENISQSIERIIEGDSASINDIVEIARLFNFQQFQNVLDSVDISRAKIFSEIQETLTILNYVNDKTINDTVQQLTLLSNSIQRQLASSNIDIISAITNISHLKVLVDTQTISDSRNSSAVNKGILNDNSNTLDQRTSNPIKTSNDTINSSMNGRIKLASEAYDSEDFFVVFQDFQPATIIS
jgi:hypothetical protein